MAEDLLEAEHVASVDEMAAREPKLQEASAESVRQAGIKRFAAAERDALEREQRERVTGRVQKGIGPVWHCRRLTSLADAAMVPCTDMRRDIR
jgi:hypothetical protein